jgi:ABC-type arginine/histidine transport system permease subunit
MEFLWLTLMAMVLGLLVAVLIAVDKRGKQ